MERVGSKDRYRKPNTNSVSSTKHNTITSDTKCQEGGEKMPWFPSFPSHHNNQYRKLLWPVDIGNPPASKPAVSSAMDSSWLLLFRFSSYLSTWSQFSPLYRKILSEPRGCSLVPRLPLPTLTPDAGQQCKFLHLFLISQQGAGVSMSHSSHSLSWVHLFAWPTELRRILNLSDLFQRTQIETFVGWDTGEGARRFYVFPKHANL